MSGVSVLESQVLGIDRHMRCMTAMDLGHNTMGRHLKLHAVFLRPRNGAQLTDLCEVELRANAYSLWRIRDGSDMETGERIPAVKMIDLFNAFAGGNVKRRPGVHFIDFREAPVKAPAFVELIVTVGDQWRQGAGLSALWMVGET